MRSMLPHQEKAQVCGHRLPLFVWFLFSGMLCDCAQALLGQLISLMYVLRWEKPTVCWAISYALSIAIRHTSHRYIVFGEYEGTYWASLGRVYAAYSWSILLSVLVNHMLATMTTLSSGSVWMATLMLMGCVNYFFVKNAWYAKRLQQTEVEEEEEVDPAAGDKLAAV